MSMISRAIHAERDVISNGINAINFNCGVTAASFLQAEENQKYWSSCPWPVIPSNEKDKVKKDKDEKGKDKKGKDKDEERLEKKEKPLSSSLLKRKMSSRHVGQVSIELLQKKNMTYEFPARFQRKLVQHNLSAFYKEVLLLLKLDQLPMQILSLYDIEPLDVSDDSNDANHKSVVKNNSDLSIGSSMATSNKWFLLKYHYAWNKQVTPMENVDAINGVIQKVVTLFFQDVLEKCAGGIRVEFGSTLNIDLSSDVSMYNITKSVDGQYRSYWMSSTDPSSNTTLYDICAECVGWVSCYARKPFVRFIPLK